MEGSSIFGIGIVLVAIAILTFAASASVEGSDIETIGYILVVIGAILTFAVSASVEGSDIETIGHILMGAGGIALLVGLVQHMSGLGLQSTRQVSNDGIPVAEDERIG